MGQPTQNDVHVDAILTDISTAYMNSESNYIANQVFPIIPVDKQTDKYFTYTKDDWFRDEASRRADSSESEGSGYSLSTDSYSADVYALHKDIGDQTRSNADSPINLDEDATRFVTQRLLLRQEKQFVTDFFTTSIWDTDKTVTNQWSDFVNSDPIEDVEDGKEQILKVTGYMPNTLVLGYQVWRKLRNHPDFVDRVKFTSSENISLDLVARMLEVDRVMVARSINNTAAEGVTASFDFNFGKHALLCYVAPSPGLLTPSAGYTFAWNHVSGGLGAPVGISRYRIDLKKADRIEGEAAWDNKVVGTDLGYFFSSVVA